MFDLCTVLRLSLLGTLELRTESDISKVLKLEVRRREAGSMDLNAESKKTGELKAEIS